MIRGTIFCFLLCLCNACLTERLAWLGLVFVRKVPPLSCDGSPPKPAGGDVAVPTRLANLFKAGILWWAFSGSIHTAVKGKYSNDEN